MHHLSNLPPGVTSADIERQAGDDRDALRDAIADALHRHLRPEDADDVWARLDDRRAVDEAEDVGDIERAIRRHFDPNDHRCRQVLDDVRPVAERVLAGAPTCAEGEPYCRLTDRHHHCHECGSTYHADSECDDAKRYG